MSAKDILFQKEDPYVEQLKEAQSSYSAWVSLVTHDTEIYYPHKALILILFFHLSYPLLGLALHAGFLSFYCFVFFNVYTSTSEKQKCGWGASKETEMPGLEWGFEFTHSAFPDYQSWVITCKSP